MAAFTCDITLVPAELKAAGPAGKTVIAVDVLRASTTIVRSLARGAHKVTPFTEPDEVFAAATAYTGGTALMCGERHMVRIPGFDLGNSPAAYYAERVRGRTLLLTTSNGTRIFAIAAEAAAVFTGSFVNMDAAAQAAANGDTDILIACAGTDGRMSLEDTLCAAMLMRRITAAGRHIPACTDSAAAAGILYDSLAHDLYGAVARSAHGRRLIQAGFEHDVQDACSVNDEVCVPVMKGDSIYLL